MDTWDAITSRRQVRDFTDQPVAVDDLQRILEAGRRAPSARNTQPWDFVVVRDKGRIDRLAGVWPGASWTARADTVIACVLAEPADERGRLLQRFDLGQAVMQMMITAASLDVGSGQAACEDQDLARDVLGFPADRRCVLLLALGHPADRPLAPIRRPGRRDFDEVVHFESW